MKLFKGKPKIKKEPEEITVRQKDDRRGKGNLFTKIALIVFAVFVVVSVFNMQTQITSYKKEQASLEEQIRIHKEKVEELEADLKTPFDESYIIKAAREKLGYCLPNEVLYYNDISE